MDDAHFAVFGAQPVEDQPEQKSADHRQEESQPGIEARIGPARFLRQQEKLIERDGRPPEGQHDQAGH